VRLASILIATAGCGRLGFGDYCELAAFVDDDGDGFGGERVARGECELPAGAVERGGDCDDADRDVNPDALDSCERDRSCDGVWSVNVPAGCPAIQPVIDASLTAAMPAEVQLAAGIHVENVRFRGAAVTVIGAGAGVSVLRGSGVGPVAVFLDGEGPESGLRALTITGGSCELVGTRCDGGGIRIDHASPHLEALEISGNVAMGGTTPFGGGIAMESSAATLVDLDVHDNVSGYYAAGLYISQSDDATLERVRIVRNTGPVYGGGLALYFTATRVSNVVLAANDAGTGGAIMLQGGSPRLANVTLIGNTCDLACGMQIMDEAQVKLIGTTVSGGRPRNGSGAMVVETGSLVTIAYSNFFDNGASPFSGIPDPAGSSGNVAVDPRFVDGAAADPRVWNLALDGSSLLRDAGDPAMSDRDGSRSDIGAYGGPSSW